MPTSRKQAPGNVTEYRLATLEGAVEKIGVALDGIDKTLQTMATLEQRHAGIAESVSRAFVRIEVVEKKQEALDGEFQKWFNRGVGVAVIVTFLFSIGGGLLYDQLNDLTRTVKQTEINTANLERQKAHLRAVMKKLGVDLEYIPD